MLCIRIFFFCFTKYDSSTLFTNTNFYKSIFEYPMLSYSVQLWCHVHVPSLSPGKRSPWSVVPTHRRLNAISGFRIRHIFSWRSMSRVQNWLVLNINLNVWFVLFLLRSILDCHRCRDIDRDLFVRNFCLWPTLCRKIQWTYQQFHLADDLMCLYNKDLD
jgi:hypothetical protein